MHKLILIYATKLFNQFRVTTKYILNLWKMLFFFFWLYTRRNITNTLWIIRLYELVWCKCFQSVKMLQIPFLLKLFSNQIALVIKGINWVTLVTILIWLLSYCRGFSIVVITGFVQVLENLESHGILFLSFPGLESHGILCRVMESHGKLYHYKKLWVNLYCVSWYIDKNFTECILLNYE